MLRLLRSSLLILILSVVVGCQPTVTELPTLIPLVTEAPPLDATNPPTLTRTPANTATSTPMPVIGRFATDPATIGYLRVMHAAPDAGLIDIYVDSTNFSSNVEYGLATGRTNIIAGTYTIRVTERGVSPDEAVLALVDLTIEVGQSIILVVSGVPDALGITVVEESSEPLNSDESRVNFVHAVPLAPTMKGQQDEADLSPLFDFGEQSGGIVVRSGDTTLSVATSEQVLVNYPITLFPRTHYTLIVMGRSDALDALTVLPLENQVSGRVTIRAVNVAQETDAIDIYLGDEPLAQNLAYGTAGERRTQVDGTHTLRVYLAGEDRTNGEPLLENFNFTALIDSDLSLIVMGTAPDLRVLVLNDDLSPVQPDVGRITFINALESVPGAQIGLSSAVMEELGTIGYGEASDFYPINIGQNRVFWMQDPEGIILQDNENFTVEAGRTYLYFLTDSSGEPVVITEPVEISNEVAALPTALDATPTAPTRIRLVNAVEERFAIDFTLNGETLASNLAYGQAADYVEIMTGTLPMVIQQTGGTPLVEREFRIVDGGDYSVFISGPTYDVNVLIFSDENIIVDERAITIRQVNLSTDETVAVGLVSLEATDPLTPPSTIAPSVPLGVSYLIANTDPSSVSLTTPAFEGAQDLVISDNRWGVIGARIRSYELLVGNHYDIVSTYSRDRDEIQAFVLQYPEG